MTIYAPRVIEDFSAGEVFHTGHYVLDEEALLQFSNVYDPQPLHTDADFAKDGPFGALIASGIQTIAISIRLFVEMGCSTAHALRDRRWTMFVSNGRFI